MSRTTAELVYQAADELLKEGVRPSQQNIRDRIGKGSATTIHKALSLWWAELGRRLGGDGGDDSGVPEPIINAATELWHQALNRAEGRLAGKAQAIKEKLTNERTEFELVTSELKNRAESLVGQLNKAYQRIDKLQQAVDEHLVENKKIEQHLSDANSAVSGLEREVKVQSKMISKLESNHPTGTPLSAATSSESLTKKNEITSGYNDLLKENIQLSAAISSLDSRLAEKHLEIDQHQDEIALLKRSCYQMESKSESQHEIIKARFQGQLDAKGEEIERLLALLADKR